jgi:cysteine-rich repeat protein
MDDEDGVNSCSLINPQIDVFARNLPIGTYFVRVEESGNNATTPAYLLKLVATPPGCGDSITQPTEECDDGNTTSGDGCSNLCEIEGNFCAETEDNNGFMNATSMSGCVGGSGAINS